MTSQELHTLQQGDIVQCVRTQTLYVVTSTGGDLCVTAVCTADVTNPEEWLLIARARYGRHEGTKKEQP